MKTLLIDDLRDFSPDFSNNFVDELDIARTSAEAIELLENNQYSVIYWDHDLGEDDTTMAVIDYLVERSLSGNKYNVDLCVIHTSNVVGAHNLKNAFESSPLQYRHSRVDASQLLTVG